MGVLGESKSFLFFLMNSGIESLGYVYLVGNSKLGLILLVLRVWECLQLERILFLCLISPKQYAFCPWRQQMRIWLLPQGLVFGLWLPSNASGDP